MGCYADPQPLGVVQGKRDAPADALTGKRETFLGDGTGTSPRVARTAIEPRTHILWFRRSQGQVQDLGRILVYSYGQHGLVIS